MDALLLDAEWKPKEAYRFTDQELRTQSTYNGSMAFYNPTLKMVDIPVPEPGSDQVLVEVKACGVCGSDVHLYQRQEFQVVTPGELDILRFKIITGRCTDGDIHH